MDSLLALIGRFHILLLHLPIGALLFLALFRLIPSLRHDGLQTAHRALWIIAALSTLVAAATGWALMLGQGNEWGQLGTRHQWLGTALAVVVIISAFIALKDIQDVSDGGLAIACILMVVTAHYGGSMTHGNDFLWGGPEATSYASSDEGQEDDAEIDESIAMVDPSLWSDAKAIFSEYCIDCHNPNRRRGYFDISSHEEIFRVAVVGRQ